MKTTINALFNIADHFRGTAMRYEYKNVIFPLLTLRYLYDVKDHPFAVLQDFNWGNIRASGFNVSQRLDKGFEELESQNPTLRNVFTTIRFSTIDDNALFKVISEIDRLHIEITKADKLSSPFAEISEKMLELFIDREGKVGAEYASPPELGDLLVQLLHTQSGSVYDPVAGISNFLIKAMKFAFESGNEVRVYGQEINPNTWAISRMNLIMHGIYEPVIQLGDVIRNPLWLEQNNHLRKFDYVLMNPPFSLNAWGQDVAENDLFGRFRYGIPSGSAGDLAFVLHALSSLKETGKAAIILPLGALFRGGPDKRIRESLLREDFIDSVISLPTNMFIGTSVGAAVVILNKQKPSELKGKVQLILAENDYLKRRTQNILREEDIERIVNTFNNKLDVNGYSRIVSVEELADNDWDIQPKRYFEEPIVQTDMGLIRIHREVFETSAQPKAKLKDIAEVFRGYNAPLSKERAEQAPEVNTHKIINLVDVQDGEIQLEKLSPIKLDDAKKARTYEVQQGDVILSNRGSSIKIAIVPETKEPLVISNNFIAIRPTNKYKGEYIKAFLESPLGQYYLASYQRGATIGMLSHKDVGTIPIPLLTLEQQDQLTKGFELADNEYKKSLAAAKEKQLQAYHKLYELMGIDTVMEKQG